MAETLFFIKADNPKGLAYDEVHSNIFKAQEVILRIIRQGGTNITVNGTPVPADIIEMATA